MAGPVRPAYRSREAGEGGIDVRVRPRPPRRSGGWVVCYLDRRRVISPPPPRASAIVDPRIGDLGPALLALEDGTVFPGIAFGAPIAAGGDLVVNTSQTGYQEVCTDPSYAGQVVVMTYPLIGNYGRLRRRRPVASGRGSGRSSSPTPRPRCSTTPASSRRCSATNGIPAIAGVDTRALARHLRANGCLRGIVTDARRRRSRRRRRRGRAPCRAGRTRTSSARSRRRRSRDVGARRGWRAADRDRRLRAQVEHRPVACAAAARASGSCPHTVDASDVLAADIDGVDPLARARAIRRGSTAPVALARAIIDDGRPLLGICLGHQIVGRAAGAETTPAAVRPSRREPPGPGRRPRAGPGHRPEPRGPGRRRRRCRPASGFRVSQVNLNDGSVEGLRHATLPIETVQYHPEGAPGPARRARGVRPVRRRAAGGARRAR